MAKIKKDYLGKQYEITFNVNGMIWVKVREVVRPTWKIFRTRYVDCKVKFLEDFSCVEDAVNTAFSQIMFQKKKDDENKKKIKEFQKKY